MSLALKKIKILFKGLIFKVLLLSLKIALKFTNEYNLIL